MLRQTNSKLAYKGNQAVCPVGRGECGCWWSSPPDLVNDYFLLIKKLVGTDPWVLWASSTETVCVLAFLSLLPFLSLSPFYSTCKMLRRTEALFFLAVYFANYVLQASWCSSGCAEPRREALSKSLFPIGWPGPNLATWKCIYIPVPHFLSCWILLASESIVLKPADENSLCL